MGKPNITEMKRNYKWLLLVQNQIGLKFMIGCLLVISTIMSQPHLSLPVADYNVDRIVDIAIASNIAGNKPDDNHNFQDPIGKNKKQKHYRYGERALFVIDSPISSNLYGVKSFIELNGGKVNLMFPSYILIGRFPSEEIANIVGKNGIQSIHYDKIRLTSIQLTINLSDHPLSKSGLQYWNSRFDGAHSSKLANSTISDNIKNLLKPHQPPELTPRDYNFITQGREFQAIEKVMQNFLNSFIHDNKSMFHSCFDTDSIENDLFEKWINLMSKNNINPADLSFGILEITNNSARVIILRNKFQTGTFHLKQKNDEWLIYRIDG